MKKKKKRGILVQLYILVVASLIIVGFITYFTQHSLSTKNTNEQIELVASEISQDVSDSIRQYPAYEWLLRYWYEHADELEVEYDVDYETGTVTKEKEMLLREHAPDFQPLYAREAEVSALSAADQKIYAEIVYTWALDRINKIKQRFHIDFVFIVVTDTDEGRESYLSQFFLLSGADPGAVRGSEYLQVYPLGVYVSTAGNKSQQDAMRAALLSAESEETFVGKLAEAGDYVDYYSYLSAFGNKAVLVGLTFNISGIRADVAAGSRTGTIYGVIYQYILLQLILISILFFGIRPLKKILRNIRMYTKNKNSEEVTKNLTEILNDRNGFAIRNNEIGELSEDMITLAHEIDDYTTEIEQISAERQRIGTELQFASEIQYNVLPYTFPPFPDRDEFDLFASMDPAREVGGDFYDFFLIDEDHLAIVIADVSGKGVPAALFMMATQIVIKNLTTTIGDPSKVLAAANAEICSRNPSDMFVTVWLGILEISTGKLTAANAGHEFPFLKEPEGDFAILKDKHGFVLGGMENMKYKSYEIQLKPGTFLFLYTDGLMEANNAKNDMFGAARILEALNREKDESPEDILKQVRRAVDEFVGEEEQFDDLTMLCLKYKGKQR